MVHLINQILFIWIKKKFVYLFHLFVFVQLQQQEEVNPTILKKHSKLKFFPNKINPKSPWLTVGFVSVTIEIFVVRVSLSESASIFDSSACISFTSDFGSWKKQKNKTIILTHIQTKANLTQVSFFSRTINCYFNCSSISTLLRWCCFNNYI